eukprot:scaffold111089_cov48-Phaeocystis_antarctica.AAC.2
MLGLGLHGPGQGPAEARDGGPPAGSKRPPWQCPSFLGSCASSERAWRLWAASTPTKRPAHWAPSHCLGCLIEPPPKPPIPPPLAIQVRPSMVATKPAATSPTRNQPTPAMAATRTLTPTP